MPKPSISSAVYARAECALPWRVFESVLNPSVKPHWLASRAAFWYQRQTVAGHAFVIFEVETRKAGPLFDHAVLAARLAEATGRSIDPAKLSIASIEFAEAGGTVGFTHDLYGDRKSVV